MVKPVVKRSHHDVAQRVRSAGLGSVAPKPAETTSDAQFDESLAWRRPIQCSDDQDLVFGFTRGAMRHADFLDLLVGRSQGDETLVDIMFALMLHFVFEGAKRELAPVVVPLLSHHAIGGRLRTGLVDDYRHEFERIKYPRHLFDVLSRMQGSLVFKARYAFVKRQNRANQQAPPPPFQLKLPPCRVNGRNNKAPGAVKAVTYILPNQPLNLATSLQQASLTAHKDAANIGAC